MPRVPERLLVVALPEESHLPPEAYQLLCQRLVLLAISETKALEIAFIDCSALARSFDIEGQVHVTPALRDRVALSVLGSPVWLRTQGTPWTEWLKPTAPYTSYIKSRLDAVSSLDETQLVRAGLTVTMSKKLLDKMSFDDLKAEADFVAEGLAQGVQISKLTSVFRMKKQVEAVLAARPEVTTPVVTHSLVGLLDG